MFKLILIVGISVALIACNNEKEGGTKWSSEEFEQYKSTLDSNFATRELKLTLEAKVLQEDFLVFRYILENAQTSIYRYSSKSIVDSIFESEFQRLNGASTYYKLLQSLARVQNEIACGHSGWSHHKDYYAFRNDSILLFPFEIEIENGRVYVFRNNSKNAGIQTGDQPLKLNGQPIMQVINKLKLYMVKDGNSAPDSYKDVESSFSNAYSNFMSNPDSFVIELKSGETVVIEGLKKQVIDSLRTKRYGKIPRPNKLLEIDVIDSSKAAVFTIRSFNNNHLQAFGQNFIDFTDSVFNILNEREITQLVIDLRGNVGGWTANGRALFSYFIEDTLQYMNKVETKKTHYEEFEPFVVNYPGYPDTAVLKLNGDLYQWKNYPSLVAIPVSKNRFAGKVYVLIDHLTRSCSSVFSAKMKEHNLATIIGEENGATFCGSNAMVMSFRLPHSGITVYTSTAKYSTAISDSLNSRGTIPDIKLPPKQTEFALDSAMNLINCN